MKSKKKSTPKADAHDYISEIVRAIDDLERGAQRRYWQKDKTNACYGTVEMQKLKDILKCMPAFGAPNGEIVEWFAHSSSYLRAFFVSLISKADAGDLTPFFDPAKDTERFKNREKIMRDYAGSPHWADEEIEEIRDRMRRGALITGRSEGFDILDEARKIVRERRAIYGSPKEDFTRIAGMWSALLGVKIDPEDIAPMMICLKLSRDQQGYKRDNMVDVCGYAKCREDMEG